MAAITFSADEADTFTMRKALFRMLLTRSAEQLSEAPDLAELEESEAMEGLALDLMDAEQRARITEAVLRAAKKLRWQITTGESVEEKVLPDTEEKLRELIGFLASHTPA